MLYARYLGWVEAQFIGRAGERVTHASLLAAAPAGYRLVQPGGGEIRQLFGSPVPRGPLDNAAYLQLVDANHRPVGSAVLPVEVKNIRKWVYPDSNELYDILDKAAHLQLSEPTLRFTPVLVCRRAHYTTFRMALDLGFFVAETRAQFIQPVAKVDPSALAEVSAELAFQDLARTDSAHPRLTALFSRTLPKVADRTATRFAQAAQIVAQHSALLRDGGLTPAARVTFMHTLRDDAAGLSWFEGGW